MRYFAIIIIIFAVTFCYTQDIQFSEHVVEDFFGGPAGIYLADLNGDLRKDVVSASLDNGEISWWENEEGILDNWTKHEIGFLPEAIYVHVEDINNDNFNDVIVAGWGSDIVAWWENSDGTGLNMIYHEVDNSFQDAHEVFAADVNGDGFMDILGAAAVDKEIAWWENSDGTGTSWTKHVVDDDFDGARSVDTADIIPGGMLEIVGAALLDDEVSWWEYDNNNEEWIKHELVGNFNNSHQVVICDMNQDDFPDILATAFSDGIIWFENNADNPPTFTQRNIDVNFGGAVISYPADFNDDGFMDVAGSSQGMHKVAWWDNVNGTFEDWEMHEICPFFNNVWPLHVGDIDNDDDIDIVAGGQVANEIRWWENLNLYADFSVDSQTGNAPSEIVFSDQSLGDVISWNWDFENDGIIDSNEQNPTFIYQTPGLYSVRLEIFDGDNITESIKEDFIQIFNGHTALEFTEIESNILVQASDIPAINGAFTIETWIYPYSYGPDANFGLARILDKTAISIFLNNEFPLYEDRCLILQIEHSDGTISTSTTPANSIVLNTWQHLAVSYDGIDEIRMFVNGYQMMFSQPTAPIGDVVENIDKDLILGNNVQLSKGFDGVIDEVRIWNEFMDQNDIQSRMNKYLNGYEPDLELYWKMNEGEGDNIIDETDNISGTINEASWQQGIELDPAGTYNLIIPNQELLLINYPNPFNPTTTISFKISNDKYKQAELVIFNLKGQKVKTFFNLQITQSSDQQIVWNGTDDNNKPVSSGIYYAFLKYGNSRKSIKMLLLK